MIIELSDIEETSKVKFSIDDGDKYVFISFHDNEKDENNYFSIQLSFIELQSALNAIKPLIKK